MTTPRVMTVFVAAALVLTAPASTSAQESGWILWQQWRVVLEMDARGNRVPSKTTAEDWAPYDGYGSLAECRTQRDSIAGNIDALAKLYARGEGVKKTAGARLRDQVASLLVEFTSGGSRMLELQMVCLPGIADPRRK